MPELQERETTALSNSQMETAGNIELLPPQDVVLNSRAVMGAIDLDPWSCPNQNLLVQSARYYNRYQEDLDDICARPWTCRGEKRAFMIGKGAKETKRLLHKLLREYRQGTISEAVIWLQHNESLARLPWIWNFPVCIPFKRLRPCWRDEEIDQFRTYSPAVWSVVFYMPPADTPDQYHYKLARFTQVFKTSGRVIFNEDDSNDWEAGYQKSSGHVFNYRA